MFKSVLFIINKQKSKDLGVLGHTQRHMKRSTTWRPTVDECQIVQTTTTTTTTAAAAATVEASNDGAAGSRLLHLDLLSQDVANQRVKLHLESVIL